MAAVSGPGGGARSPLLDDVVNGAVDHRGQPVRRSSSGGWTSAGFIIGVEVAERFAYYGISSNLINYLTGPLGQSVATAAENVSAWEGMASLSPLLGAFIADSFLGRYRTIVIASVVYIAALGLLTLSAVLPSLRPSDCQTAENNSCSPPLHQVVLFFFSLYLVAIAQGGHKPCVQAFGADQFDGQNPQECKAKSSFFNWWYFSALGLFLLGTKTYRFSIKGGERSPFLRFLNKALLAPDGSEDGKICTFSEVEEAKAVLGLSPIWATGLVYAVVFQQPITFFNKQGVTMDRSIRPGLNIPSASLQSFIGIGTVLFIPIYERVLVPLARAFTGRPVGITMLQRIGIGMFLSITSMVVAALVESERLKTARECGLIDKPNATVPMSVWWLIPQYVLIGVSDVFTMVGLQEFFYDQVPSEWRSIGLSLYLSIFGVGSFLSSFLVSAIEKATGGGGREGWFANNLNKAHLDYFYWLLAGMSALELIAFIYFANSYVYNRARQS
ncbi:hypothetical protein CRG98_022166 [Punica granatum]|uniref:Protein NRT1/ PTR FAMILY 5.10-like n=1 Tax=Punica granatum TaxID=22663 RepID=A0A2I0JMK6_PUNGR|nr:hypothetical protein CRG98_022166 [Punica granatum]